MLSPEPLLSAMSIRSAEDTSLAIPSDNSLRTGQQRVMDQVHTIKRSKSKSGRNGTLSPTPTSPGPQPMTTYEFGTFKFSPSKINSNFSRINSTVSSGYSKSYNTHKSRTLSSKSLGGKHISNTGLWDQQISTSTWPKGPNGLKPSRSDPALAPAPAHFMRGRGLIKSQQNLQSHVNRHSVYSMNNGIQMINKSRFGRSPSALSQTDGRLGTLKIPKIEQLPGAVKMSDLTLKDAVGFLSHDDENYQQCGANFIQHATYNEDSAKQEVYKLGGIPFLVELLRSHDPAVSQAAAGALRNLVFNDQTNKREVQQYEGIAKALQLLKETDSTDTQKQVAGLLWNLSCDDKLKAELVATALPVLTENVVVPFTSWSDSSANNNIHPDVFNSATGCLRNLSCGTSKERKAMRECPYLIDSIMSYVQSCVAEENPDDMSVENCVCILHNLTYQLEEESPQCFSKLHTLQAANQTDSDKSAIGCFSPRSSKVPKDLPLDAVQEMLDDINQSGENLLCKPKTMHTYLSLLGSSQKSATLEACCGALQNLTASKGVGSSAISQILVRKLGALTFMSSLLKSSNPKLQKTAMSLLGNLARTSNLQNSMAKQILPDITSLLTSTPQEKGKSDETIAIACSTARSLMMADPETSKKFVSSDLVASLVGLSDNGSFPKGSKAAALLLYSLWDDNKLQCAVKKLGLSKSSFVNDNTTAVHRLAQIID